MVILLLINLLFFYPFYNEPFRLASSELLSTFYPSWLWQGRQVRQRRFWKAEPSYWLNFHAHPVLSSYYPPHILTAWISSFMSLDSAFAMLTRVLFLHFLWASIGWYLVLRPLGELAAIFGAITFTYQAYHLKLQPCIVYTLAWLPWAILGHGVALSAILLAGYYPLAFYLIPLAIPFLSPIQIAIGLAIGSIQLIPFLRYLPKTIRSTKSTNISVGAWEKDFYIGITPYLILAYTWKPIYLVATIPLLSYFIRDRLPRVYQRAWILSAYAVIYFSCVAMPNKPALLLIQVADLWLHSRKRLVAHELANKPSWAFNTRLTKALANSRGLVSGLPYPLFTGLVNNLHTLGYSGGMQLKLMAKWRGDKNPNGSGNHDWFKENEDGPRADRIEYAYTTKSLDWQPTGLRNLYRNPRFSGS